MDVLTCADVQQTVDSAHFFVFEEVMRCGCQQQDRACSAAVFERAWCLADNHPGALFTCQSNVLALLPTEPRGLHPSAAMSVTAVCVRRRAELLAFSRDASVMQQAAAKPDPVLTAGAAPQPRQPLRAYPPSGVLPFQGLSAYLAPLCYLYSSPAMMYPVWHAMYCQYWCRLHSLDSSPAPTAGLPVLCRTFLDLLQVGLASHGSTHRASGHDKALSKLGGRGLMVVQHNTTVSLEVHRIWWLTLGLCPPFAGGGRGGLGAPGQPDGHTPGHGVQLAKLSICISSGARRDTAAVGSCHRL